MPSDHPSSVALRTELWLVRHAESTGNRDQLIQGQADMPLSPHGHRQARALAERLHRLHKRVPFAALVSSDLLRTRETAEAVGAVLDLPLRTDRRLREIDVGTWSGLDTGAIAERFPAEWQAWQGRDPHLRRGGGESYQDAHDRIAPALAELAAAHPGGRVVVVSHGGVLRAWLGGLVGLDLADIWHFAIGNTAICRVRPNEAVSGGGRPRYGRILSYNDCAHTEELRTEE